jgi:glycosyltransferase involved in cell wall biosynthesis
LAVADGYGMNTASSPLVSIVVPVYQGAGTLAECLESVLAQTYHHWDCTIVENCSTDATLEIARQFASREPRIRVVRNRTMLPALANHNAALRQMSPDSKYCKVVFADDWIFPDCLSEMVGLAEQYPTVGLVGAYWRQGDNIAGVGLDPSKTVFFGRDVGRRHFLESLYAFGSANSLLYRADLVRARQPFFDEMSMHADTEICFELLKSCDFGFVHRTLTFTRVRPDSLTARSAELQTYFASTLRALIAHGRDYLAPEEFDRLLDQRLSEYYQFLSANLLRGRGRTFWAYHKAQLDATTGFSWARLAGVILKSAARAAQKPGVVFDKLRGQKRGSAA